MQVLSRLRGKCFMNCRLCRHGDKDEQTKAAPAAKRERCCNQTRALMRLVAHQTTSVRCVAVWNLFQADEVSKPKVTSETPWSVPA